MGSMLEINDTLEITDAQGFPSDLLNLDKHRAKPITLADVEGRIFNFQLKPNPRIYQLAGVRVFYVHNINDKWLFWGHIFVLSQTISVSSVTSDGQYSFMTSGTYQIVELYDPIYQEAFTRRESPPGLSYFGDPPK